jgi:tetratricopeptide (TPR) repeat protein
MTGRGGRRRLVVAVAAVTAGCVGAAADHEVLGDRAYAERRFADALVEYRLALVRRAPDAALRWKAGQAALNAEDFSAAASEFLGMGREAGPGRAADAADGLVRVAHAAVADGDRAALAAALEALQIVAPGRALGTFADALVRVAGQGLRAADALTVLVYAAAAARDARTQDSLMLAYAVALRRSDRCGDALPVFESLVRRQRDAAITGTAREGVVTCALGVGRAALDAGQPGAAEEWFETAITRGGDGPGVRLAYLGLGDVRFAAGDVVGAVEAYEQARAGLSPGDSVYAIVAERLNRIARPEPDE